MFRAALAARGITLVLRLETTLLVAALVTGCAKRPLDVPTFAVPPKAAAPVVTDKHCHWTSSGTPCSGVDKLPAWAAYCVCTLEI
jgi:hypothetical protein